MCVAQSSTLSSASHDLSRNLLHLSDPPNQRPLLCRRIAVYQDRRWPPDGKKFQVLNTSATRPRTRRAIATLHILGRSLVNEHYSLRHSTSPLRDRATARRGGFPARKGQNEKVARRYVASASIRSSAGTLARYLRAIASRGPRILSSRPPPRAPSAHFPFISRSPGSRSHAVATRCTAGDERGQTLTVRASVPGCDPSSHVHRASLRWAADVAAMALWIDG